MIPNDVHVEATCNYGDGTYKVGELFVTLSGTAP
jgi:hypothetical protein